MASLESHLFHRFDANSPLVNGTVPPEVVLPDDRVPTKVRVQIMTDDEIETRRQPRYRFPRQVQQFNQLLDYILITKDEPHLRRALDVHFLRVQRFYEAFRIA